MGTAKKENNEIKNQIAKVFHDILMKIHNNCPQKSERVEYLEIYYAFCIFISMEADDIFKKFQTAELRQEYEMIRIVVEECFTKLLWTDAVVPRQRKEFYDANFSFVYNAITEKEFDNHREKNVFLIGEILGCFKEVPEKTGMAYQYLGNLAKICTDNLGNEKPFIFLDKGSVNFSPEKVDEGHKNKNEEERSESNIPLLRKNLQKKMKEKIKGQDMAVDKFVDSYIRYKMRGKEDGKPAVVSLFAGPPGTGKTYLAETFAGALKKEGYVYKRFDMSVYGGNSMQAVEGLVGFERTWKNARPGQLTDFVIKHPKCVLLFDEIEKAGQSVIMLFLSMLEGARLIDRYNEKAACFEDAIIIFTTNEGKELYLDNFDTNLTALSDSAVLNGLANSKFPPELISRFASGNVIMFNHLNYRYMEDVLVSNLENAVGRLQKNKDFTFKYDQENLPRLFLYNKGRNVDARFVSATIRKMVENQYMKALEYVSTLEDAEKGIRKISACIKVKEEIREYFSLRNDFRILCFSHSKKCAYKKEIDKYANTDWTSEVEEFKEKLAACNWNSKKAEEKYQAIFISLSGERGKKCVETKGYQCLLAVENNKKDIPVIIEQNTSANKKVAFTEEEKNLLKGHGATDFADVYSEQLEHVLKQYDFVEKATELSGDGKKISADVTYDYNAKTGEVQIVFSNLNVNNALEESAREREMNKRYLLNKKPQTRLEDIFGNELAKETIKRCIDNIKCPEKYLLKGAKLMSGIIMHGAPGMGKTMFAKAMAQESGAEFISTVGSDFIRPGGIEILESIFATARRKNPCIIFIDEFDAIAMQRKGNPDYQEMVQNRLLKEMDGLESENDGVYVVAATNYHPDRLDRAVTRRFSAHIEFTYPDLKERLQYIMHILRKKGLEEVVSERTAKTLNMMMYSHMRNFAEIENFFEEAVAEAVYKRTEITERFLLNFVHNTKFGKARQEENAEELAAVAFHEAGHTVLQWYYDNKPEYVTIVSRGSYGGYAMASEKSYTQRDYLNRIRVFFAGRMAEKIYFENQGDKENKGINVGASSDLEGATKLAYDYVSCFGFGTRLSVMSDLLVYGERNPEDILPEEEKVAIWAEVNRILQEEQENAKQDLMLLWGKVTAIAISLMFMKELDGETIERVMETEIPEIEEYCFGYQSGDYAIATEDGTETFYPYGYPIFPLSVINCVLRENISQEEESYYYAVKSERKSFGIYKDIKEAFAIAYREKAACRRFINEEAAREYVQMMEVMVCRKDEGWELSLVTDALSKVVPEDMDKIELVQWKEKEAKNLRKEAKRRGMSLAEYIVNVEIKEKRADVSEDLGYIFYIYDEALKNDILNYWNGKTGAFYGED